MAMLEVPKGYTIKCCECIIIIIIIEIGRPPVGIRDALTATTTKNIRNT